jgi:hypothetical protein
MTETSSAAGLPRPAWNKGKITDPKPTRAVGEVLLLDLANEQRCEAVPPCAERHCRRRLIATMRGSRGAPPHNNPARSRGRPNVVG